MRKFSSRQKEFPDKVACAETCDCRAGTCMLDGAIKARNGKSSSERPKIPRGNIPIACGQCLNSFG
jgi:hypothetical protein